MLGGNPLSCQRDEKPPTNIPEKSSSSDHQLIGTQSPPAGTFQRQREYARLVVGRGRGVCMQHRCQSGGIPCLLWQQIEYVFFFT